MSGVARQRGEARAEVLQQQTLLRRLTALATCLVATPIRRGAALRAAATIGFRADQPVPKGAADGGAAPHRPPRLISLLNSRRMLGTRANAVPARPGGGARALQWRSHSGRVRRALVPLCRRGRGGRRRRRGLHDDGDGGGEDEAGDEAAEPAHA